MQPENTGLLATQAMIHAASGRSAEALDALDALQKDQPKLAETSRRVVESILNNQNSHFCILPAREDLFDDFWKAFAEKAGKLRQLYETDEDSRAIAMLEKMFAPLFPFPGEEVSFRLKMNPQNQMALDLIDGYSLSLEAGIEKLLKKCPPEIKAGWAIHSAH